MGHFTDTRLLYKKLKLNSIMEPLPDMSSMDKKALESLVLDLYQRSCQAFGDTFDVQHVVRFICRCHGHSFLRFFDLHYKNTTKTFLKQKKKKKKKKKFAVVSPPKKKKKKKKKK